MKLLMESKGKVMDNCLFNLKLTVAKTELKMLCDVALIWTINCIADVISTVVCQVNEVVRFLSSFHVCLFLSYINQTTKSNLLKTSNSRGYGIFKTKQKFLITTVIIFFINNKTQCSYFNSFMPGGRKRSNILKQTYSQKLVFILSMYGLLSGKRELKGGIVKEY